MPTIMTIEGTRMPKRKRSKSRKSSRASKSRKGCKVIKAAGRGCTQLLCKVAKSKKHPSGWSFKKGSRKCSR